jgi:DNA-binding MarR family transcriptional regulator
MVSPGKMISRIYWCTQAYMEKKLGIYGIGSGEVAILMTLHKEDALTQGEIAEKIHVDKATVSREVRKLLRNGYLERKRDEKDRRRHIISLSPEGKKIIPEIKKVLLEWKKILLHGFSKEERAFIMKAIEKMEQNAIKAMEAMK